MRKKLNPKYQDAKRFLNHLVEELNVSLRDKGGRIFSGLYNDLAHHLLKDRCNEVYSIRQKISLLAWKDIAHIWMTGDENYFDVGVHVELPEVMNRYGGILLSYVSVEDTSPRDRKIESATRRMILENEYAFDSAFLVRGGWMNAKETQVKGPKKRYSHGSEGMFRISRLEDLKEQEDNGYDGWLNQI